MVYKNTLSLYKNLNVNTMTTLIIDIQNSDDAKKIADALRLMKSVGNITVRESCAESIHGLPYTTKDRIASIQRAEDDYAQGRFTTSEEMKQRHIIA